MTTALATESEIGRLLGGPARDPVVFFEQVLGIAVNPAQRRWLALVTPTDGWSWPLHRVIHVAANQIGKSLAVAGLILWACIYKIGVDPSDPKAWIERSYPWFHVAPRQQQAYHPANDIREIIAGAHIAQARGAERGLKFRLPPGLVTATKVAQYYDGFEFVNGAQAQFRTTDDKASALQGYRAAGISFDEAAFEDNLHAVVNEALEMRLISTGGPLLLVSTPNGLNSYFDFVSEVTTSPTARNPEPRLWIDNERSSAVVHSIIDENVGFGVTAKDVAVMEATLDPATKEQQLRGAFLEPAEAFFVPTAAVLKAFRDIPAEQSPEMGHKYVAFWDPSLSSDPTAVVVLDVTRKPWVGVYYRHYKRPMGITELIGEIHKVHLHYNSATDPRRVLPRSRCVTGYDATSMGGVMIGQLLQGIKPLRPLNFGGPDKKIKTLTNLRAILTRDSKPREIVLPNHWTQLRQEVLNYRLADKKLVQDSVMALDGAVHVAGAGVGTDRPHKFNPSARVTPHRLWR